MPFVIRPLAPADIALMEAMMTMFGRAFEDSETYTEARPQRAYLSGDDPAIALYTKLGAREDVLHFDIPVRKTPGREP